MSTPDLTPEQEAHAQELAKTALQALEGDILRMTGSWLPSLTAKSWGRRNSRFATSFIRSTPKAILAELDARQKKLPRIRA